MNGLQILGKVGTGTREDFYSGNTFPQFGPAAAAAVRGCAGEEPDASRTGKP